MPLDSAPSPECRGRFLAIATLAVVAAPPSADPRPLLREPRAWQGAQGAGCSAASGGEGAAATQAQARPLRRLLLPHARPALMLPGERRQGGPPSGLAPRRDRR
eukprot:scaffold507_cov391-Prasinococcus_capsulatus_cf.AAC.14